MSTFVAKVKKIRNRKGKNYFIYRVNLPASASKDLKIGEEDYLLINARKAEWYHLLDWPTMKKTWDKLPLSVKNDIVTSGLSTPEPVIEDLKLHLQRTLLTSGLTRNENGSQLTAGNKPTFSKPVFNLSTIPSETIQITSST
jgi:hypothetical protein